MDSMFVSGARRGDAALVARLELGHAAGVIGVVMGDQDVGELPAGCPQGGFDRPRLGCVDRGGRAGRRVVHQHAEIIAEASKQVRLGGHFALSDC